MSVRLRDAAGIRVPLTHGSLLIGRAPSCHIVVSDPRISRQHVLVTWVPGGAQVVSLGRTPALLRGEPVQEPVIASDGDRLEIEGTWFEFEIAADDKPGTWTLATGGLSYPLRKTPFTVGGAPGDDLQFEGWPPSAVVFYQLTSGVVAEVHDGVELGGCKRVDGVASLLPGATLRRGDVTLRLIAAGDAAATIDLDAPVTSADLELMPGGALLKLRSDRDHSVWLPKKRGDLVAALLSPPHSNRAGDWISDELLIPRVWGKDAATRTQLNTLIHRTRVTLSAGGVNGATWIERLVGATRVRLAPSATVRVM